jgi:hypothetical protein
MYLKSSKTAIILAADHLKVKSVEERNQTAVNEGNYSSLLTRASKESPTSHSSALYLPCISPKIFSVSPILQSTVSVETNKELEKNPKKDRTFTEVLKEKNDVPKLFQELALNDDQFHSSHLILKFEGSHSH